MAVLLFWKKKRLEVWFEESREGLCRRGRGRSAHVEGPKTESGGGGGGGGER